jgi:acyl transferase domain-containing protein
MQGLPAGAMLAVPFGEEEARLIVRDGNLSLASINGARTCVISGAIAEVEKLEARLNADGVSSRRLQTSHAFHSTLMEPILDEFSETVRRAKLQSPKIPYVSNLTGDWIKPDEAVDARYWARHLRETVRFSDGLSRLLEEPEHVFVELGPGQTLCTLLRSHPERQADHGAIASLAAVKPAEEQQVMLKALGQLWQAGIDPNWTGFYENEKRRRLKLPTYPFERERCWVDLNPPKVAEATPPVEREEQDTVSISYQPAAEPERSEPEQLVSLQLEIIAKQLKVLQSQR